MRNRISILIDWLRPDAVMRKAYLLGVVLGLSLPIGSCLVQGIWRMWSTR